MGKLSVCSATRFAKSQPHCQSSSQYSSLMRGQRGIIRIICAHNFICVHSFTLLTLGWTASNVVKNENMGGEKSTVLSLFSTDILKNTPTWSLLWGLLKQSEFKPDKNWKITCLDMKRENEGFCCPYKTLFKGWGDHMIGCNFLWCWKHGYST